MTGTTRRQLIGSAAAAMPLGLTGLDAWAAPRPQASVVAGVQLGVQTYSYHDVPVDGGDHTDTVIAHMRANRLYSCELFGAQVEPGLFTGRRPAACAKPEIGCPPGKGGSERNGFDWVFERKTGAELARARAAVRAFRESKPTRHYEAIRRRFNDAGIELYTYNPIFDTAGAPSDMRMSDAEIDGVFYAAKALGVKAINASIGLPTLKRLIPFAEKHQVIIAVHGHSAVSDPEAFSTRKTFTDAFALSKWVWANLDIGHYTAAGEDAVEFITAFHDRITNLHLKDRKRNKSRTEEDGANVPWGQGDTPIGPVLRLLRDRRYKIPAFIEIEHIGTTSAVGEVAIAYDDCRRELARR